MIVTFKHSVLLSIFLLASLALNAQLTVVKGTVTDAKTGQPIPYAIVAFPDSDIGTVSDTNGQYVIETTRPYDTLQFSFTGYKTQEKKVKPGQLQTIDVKLSTDIKELQDVVVAGQKQTYRSNGNPAVELIRNVIEHKKDNRKENFDYYEYQQYQKIEIAVSHLHEG